MKKPKLFRQGDVLVRKVNKIPAKTKVADLDNGAVVLAYGETTGHSHAIRKGDVKKYDDIETGVSYVEVAEALAALEHEEHGTIPLKQGCYEVILQRGFSNDMVRRVAD